MLDGVEECRIAPADGRVIGTHTCPAYVSPEILDSVRGGTAYDGRAADMWCLGVLLAAMLHGRYPFADLAPAVLFARIHAVQYTFGAHVSPGARQVVRALLWKVPEERLAAGQLMRLPWMANEMDGGGACKRARVGDWH